jgi:hypothetical protein
MKAKLRYKPIHITPKDDNESIARLAHRGPARQKLSFQLQSPLVSNVARPAPFWVEMGFCRGGGCNKPNSISI